MTLYCALCLYTKTECSKAVTVIAGFATCEDHAGYFQDERLSRLISQAQEPAG